MIINFNQDATLMPPSIIVRLICIFLICTICIQCTHPATQEADKIKNLFSKKMEAEGFFLINTGSAIKDDIKELSLSYITYQNLDLAKARSLFVQKAEQLLCLVNSHPKIQPFLHERPFTYKNISLKISFLKFNDDFVEKPYVALISLNPEKKLIRYFFYDVREDRLKLSQEETYEEALEKFYRCMSSPNSS